MIDSSNVTSFNHEQLSHKRVAFMEINILNTTSFAKNNLEEGWIMRINMTKPADMEKVLILCLVGLDNALSEDMLFIYDNIIVGSCLHIFKTGKT